MSVSVSGNGAHLARGCPQCHPHQDHQLPVPAAAWPAGSPGLEWQWDVEELHRGVSLAQGAGQALFLWSGSQAVWAVLLQAEHQAGRGD